MISVTGTEKNFTVYLLQPSDGLILDIQGADECLLMAMKRSSSHAADTSAYPPTTDIQNCDVRFGPNYFRFTPNSGRS